MQTIRRQWVFFIVILILASIVGIANKVIRYLPDWIIDLSLLIELVCIAVLLIWIIISRRQQH